MNVIPQEIATKSQERRKQVLDAAAKCFGDLGFHGCSIAKISQASGMSPGHIYYHFANKEAIVEALVARQESTLSELIADMASSPAGEPLATTLKKQTRRMVALHTSPHFMGLWLEIAAESMRNPRVAELVQLSHTTMCSRFSEQVLQRAQNVDEEESARLRTRLDIIASLFRGLSQHAALSGHEEDRDHEQLTETINSVIDLFFAGY